MKLLFYSRIPTLSTASTLAALTWGWTRRASLNNHRRVWPGVVALAHHWRTEPDHQVSRCPVQLVLDPRFTRWQPVLRVRCCFANFKYIVQVLQVWTSPASCHLNHFCLLITVTIASTQAGCFIASSLRYCAALIAGYLV